MAIVLGWKVIVPSNQYKICEKIMCFEIDSIHHANNKWKKKIKPKNLHIKTVSRYNEISQGHIMK